MAVPLRVLVLEDQPEDAESMLLELRRAGFLPDWLRIEREEEYLEHLTPEPDVILAEYSLRGFGALSALAVLRARGLDIPFIVVTGALQDEQVMECIRLGAADYLLKDRLARLGPAVTRALAEKEARRAQRRAEDALRVSEARFRLLAENSRDMLYRYRFLPERGFEYVSPAATRMTGYAPEEFYADPTMDSKLVHPDDRHIFHDALRSCRGGPVVLRWVRKDGAIVWTEQLPTLFRDESGAIVACESVVRDIGERVRAEVAWRESEERYRTLVDGIDDGIHLKDLQGRYVTVNSEFLRRRGLPREEILGKTAVDVYPPARAKCIVDADRQVIETGQVVDSDVMDEDQDGERVYHSRKLPLRNDAGDVVGVITISRDVTERRSAERRVRENEARLRRAIEGMVNAMAATYELRDPYTAGHQRNVSRLAEGIARRMDLPEEQIEGIRLAAAIHDIGKISVPAEILSRPGRLSDLEFRIIKGHPESGYEILKGIDFPWPIAEVVHQHHERLDGSGYPRGLVGHRICLGARILAVADVVEAVASHRPYRPARGKEEALNEISSGRGTLFDPVAVDACLCLLRDEGYSYE